jgi:hypothetical protein
MGLRRRHASYLFSVRLWMEDMGDGQTEWRGQLRHVASGETRYFRDWLALVALLQALLPIGETAPQPTHLPDQLGGS